MRYLLLVMLLSSCSSLSQKEVEAFKCLGLCVFYHFKSEVPNEAP